ncbi:UNC93-like protein MFSD11 [Aphelenchoides bicaudatus]|nr:UNC93-like protein MFSD11 [Aphelenchoides bicaudatus]
MHTNTSNVVQLGGAFFLLFFAFNSASSILVYVLEEFRENGQVSKNDGYTGLAIIYGTFSLSNLLSAGIVHNLGTRYSMTLGSTVYAIFQAGFIFFNQPYLYTSAVLLGIGASILWTAQSNYLATNSNGYTAGRHSAIFWGVLQSSQIVAGLFLLFAFHFRSNIDYQTIYLIFGVFTMSSLGGVVMLLSLRGAQSGKMQFAPKMSTLAIASRPQYNHWKVMKSTVCLFASRRMILFIPVFVFLGMEQAFSGPVYSTTIAFTLTLGMNSGQLIALNLIVQGAGQIAGSFVFGMFNRKFGHVGRDRMIAGSTLTYLAAYLAVYFNFPHEASLQKTLRTECMEPQISIVVLCSFIFGFADSCWNIQITSFLITRFHDKSVEAFSLFKIFQTMASALLFFFSQSFRLNQHVIFLSAGCVIACISFVLVERFIFDKNSNFYRENRKQINYIQALAYQQKKLSSRSETFPSNLSSCSTTPGSSKDSGKY